MLLQIREFIYQQRVVSTQQLAREFHLDEGALKPMLDLWERKGVIRPCQEERACQSSCFQCKTTAPLYYQYID